MESRRQFRRPTIFDGLAVIRNNFVKFVDYDRIVSIQFVDAPKLKPSNKQSDTKPPGYIAQWLERLTADQQVPGSNPGVPFFLFCIGPTA